MPGRAGSVLAPPLNNALAHWLIPARFLAGNTLRPAFVIHGRTVLDDC